MPRPSRKHYGLHGSVVNKAVHKRHGFILGHDDFEGVSGDLEAHRKVTN